MDVNGRKGDVSPYHRNAAPVYGAVVSLGVCLFLGLLELFEPLFGALSQARIGMRFGHGADGVVRPFVADGGEGGGGHCVVANFGDAQRSLRKSAIVRPASLTIPPIVYALTGLCRGMVRIRTLSVITICFPCRAILKPAFSRARTASR